MSQEVIEKEVVQLVRSHEVFCFLLDITVLVGRGQLRRNRCVDDIAKGLRQPLTNLRFWGFPLLGGQKGGFNPLNFVPNQVLDERLRY